jgi:hypothetical protein
LRPCVSLGVRYMQMEDVCDKNGIAWRALASEGGPWR